MLILIPLPPTFGETVADRNKRLVAIINGVAELDFGNFEDNQIDLFGDAYEFLISNYAANAGNQEENFSPLRMFPNSLLS